MSIISFPFLPVLIEALALNVQSIKKTWLFIYIAKTKVEENVKCEWQTKFTPFHKLTASLRPFSHVK